MVRPGVEVFTPRDRAAWLKVRGKDVTASVVGALFNAHEFITPYELWARKTGRLPKDSEETVAMRRGRLLEPVAVQMLRVDHPDWQIEYSTAEQTLLATYSDCRSFEATRITFCAMSRAIGRPKPPQTTSPRKSSST